jgi:uncharacterized protein (DUF1499 family)
MSILIILAVLVVAGAVGYRLLEKRPGYGAYYGLAKLTGAPLDIGPVDWATLRRHRTENDALVCPASLCPNAKPDREPKIYTIGPGELLARLKTTALAAPDTRELPSAKPDRVRFLQHSRLMRFPDTIDAEVFSADGGATLAIYSRSLIGRKDFGVNSARVTRWLTALERA